MHGWYIEMAYGLRVRMYTYVRMCVRTYVCVRVYTHPTSTVYAMVSRHGTESGRERTDV